MADDSKIEWTDATWPITVGCTRTAPAGSAQSGCGDASGGGCYAEQSVARVNRCSVGAGREPPYADLVKLVKRGDRTVARWTGHAKFFPDRLAMPLAWRRPRRIFVSSQSDLFHESLTNEQIAAVFGVMAAAPQHSFQVLTKRARRMREWFEWVAKNTSRYTWPTDERRPAWEFVEEEARAYIPDIKATATGREWPLSNVWLGVSVENQAAADERIPELLRTPAAVRWLSCEPLLGPVEIRGERDRCGDCDPCLGGAPCSVTGTHLNALHPDGINWIVAGCESGPGARPCDVAWLRSLRDQCAAAGVAFFLKQAVEGGDTPIVTTNGERAPAITAGPDSHRKAGGIIGLPYLDGRQHAEMPEERRRG
jgi:protein gp37